MLKTNNYRASKAFSLIELSIVILIIGIIIAGVTQGSRIVTQMRLHSARMQTKSSPVSSIKDIVGWWESTLEESFGGELPEEVPNGGENGISIWYDINPHTANKNNAVSNNPENNPGYTYVSTINGLPTVKFNGSNFLHFDGTGLAKSNYSIFIVEQRTANNSDNLMLAASGEGDTNQMLIVGYGTNTRVAWAQYGNDGHFDIDGFSGVIPRVHSLVFNSTATSPKIYRLNGVSQDIDFGDGEPSHGLDSYNNATIAYYQNGNYQGNIGEIIIFNRGLNNEERESIEKYLGKKWGIKIEQIN